MDEEKRWYSTALKQRNIVDSDWALANQNMSDEDSEYYKAEHTINNISILSLDIWGKNDKTTPEQMIIDNVKGIKHSTRIPMMNAVMHHLLINPKNYLKIFCLSSQHERLFYTTIEEKNKFNITNISVIYSNMA